MKNNIEVWKFGTDKTESDYLFNLVKQGIKTATSYLYTDENYVTPNKFSILCNWDGNEEIKLETINFYIVPFKDVTELHAYKEGEGDRTLNFWRKIHKDFFVKRLMLQGRTFSEDVLVVCEEFKML